MEMYKEALGKLKESIFSSDILILIVGMLTFVFMLATLGFAKAVEHRTKEWEKNKNVKFSKWLLKMMNIFYTLFISFISLFPLLGMLGTVVGLLGLDMTSGDMNNIKSNFFIALTSTAWGIIFSVIFKVFNAFISDYVEEQIENAKKLSDERAVV